MLSLSHSSQKPEPTLHLKQFTIWAVFGLRVLSQIELLKHLADPNLNENWESLWKPLWVLGTFPTIVTENQNISIVPLILSCLAAHSPFIANVWCKSAHDKMKVVKDGFWPREARILDTSVGNTHLKQFLRLQITTLEHRFQSIELTSPSLCSQLRRGYSFARLNNTGTVDHTP